MRYLQQLADVLSQGPGKVFARLIQQIATVSILGFTTETIPALAPESSALSSFGTRLNEWNSREPNDTDRRGATSFRTNPIHANFKRTRKTMPPIQSPLEATF